MVDSDLAALSGLATRALTQAVKRNMARFSQDFMFQLSPEEFENWRSQIVISKPGAKMGLCYAPFAFTEHGVAMLSSVLRSQRTIEVSISIVSAFIRLRQVLAANEEIARKVAQHDHEIGILFDQVRAILETPEPRRKLPIGFAEPPD
ncbi:MAG: ORF6N domain-containing protein [Acidobacteria bacterium]|nr:ORF6N domain-containing protein [Acidobacteriota bacterium]